jgi:hypothetical protein
MPKKRRRKGDVTEDSDFQMMDVDVNPSPSVPSKSTSTMINISQWDIEGDRIHGTSSHASIDDPTAVTAPQASATDSTTQETFDYNVDVESTFHDADEDISPEDDPSGRKSFSSVSYFCLTTLAAVLNHVLSFLRITRCWHGSSTPRTFFLNSLDLMVGVSTKINRSVADARKESQSIVVGTVLEGHCSVQTAQLIITDQMFFIISKYLTHYFIQ